MKTPASCFAVALALGAITLTPGVVRAQDGRQEGPTEIEKCQTIDKPGSYKLVNNLVSTGSNCLVIATDHVTIDLAGFSISGRGTGAGVSVIGGVLLGIAVRNGSISGLDNGVLLGAADGSLVEGLRLSGPASGNLGIEANGIVKGNTVSGYSVGGIVANGVLTGNYVINSGDGVSVGPGSTVIGNTAVNNNRGLVARCPANLIDNTAVNNGTNLFSDAGCHTEDNLAP
jgi:hypothetical protein